MTVITKIPWPTAVPAPVAARPAGLAALWATWRTRRAERRVLYDLAMHQPDSVLLDAKTTRDAALRESKKPFWRA